jgi:hypothetical protein
VAGGEACAPGWDQPAAYERLRRVDRSGLAWEWLRRDPAYRAAAAPALGSGRRDGPVISADPLAARWGLHLFEDPRLGAGEARPVWRDAIWPALRAAAVTAERAADRFDVRALGPLATVVLGPRGAQHLLICDGRSSLRIDVVEGSLLDGAVALEFRLAGSAGLERRLGLLRQWLLLRRTGRLPPPPRASGHARQIALLRAHDALASGATQRQIAEQLLGRSPLPRAWRLDDPSLRLRAQRLARGARAMAAGGWTALLRG